MNRTNNLKLCLRFKYQPAFMNHNKNATLNFIKCEIWSLVKIVLAAGRYIVLDVCYGI